MYKILVTGVGAIIGYNIVKSFKKEYPSIHIIGTDIYDYAVGQHWCDEFYTVPLSSDNTYLASIKEIIKKHQIDLLIPGIEQDIFIWCKYKNELPSHCKVVLNNPDLINICQDKWLFNNYLQNYNFTTIKTFINGDYDFLVKHLGLPFIVKPRRSYASKGFKIINDKKEFIFYHHKMGDNFIAQQLVGDNNHEYTVGVFGWENQVAIPKISLQRYLSPEGATVRAKVVFNSQLDTIVDQLCYLFKPIGPTNFQFRYHDNYYYLLEINPRFSSSHSLRTAFGFNEAGMTVDYFLRNKIPDLPHIKKGAAHRYTEDYIIIE